MNHASNHGMKVIPISVIIGVVLIDLLPQTVDSVFQTVRLTVFGDLVVDCGQDLLRPLYQVKAFLPVMADMLVLVISR